MEIQLQRDRFKITLGNCRRRNFPWANEPGHGLSENICTTSLYGGDLPRVLLLAPSVTTLTSGLYLELNAIESLYSLTTNGS